MKTRALLSLACAAALPLAACGDDAIPDPPGRMVRSSLEREQNPSVPPADAADLVAGNTAFAVDMFHQLRAADENLFFSPHSISIALAMTYAGARTETELQMADALDFRLPQARLHPAFDQLDLALGSRGQGASGKDGQPFRLRIANALFGQEGYAFLPDYLDTLALNYGAGLSLFDFTTEAESARQAINGWVEDATEGRIPELLAEGVITPQTVLVLTNAVYFNASWANPFEPSATQAGTFHAPAGDISAQMMRGTEEMLYGAGAGYQAVGIPYDGDELDMVVVLPDQGGFDDFAVDLDGAGLQAIFAGLQGASVNLTLPRFELRSKAELVPAFKALGMVDAFGDADFSGMDGTRSLFIQEIVHEAFVAVDEAGTEAAAATAVVVGRTSAPAEQATVVVDRPFLVFIRDRATGAVVFAGQIVNPS
ncbi:MAG: serpin family protein [Deltaproteobacteria bacterium]|nr:serpin family protein [Deltaproteobacteria bacterium]